MANMMSAATLLGIDSLPIEGFNREKVEAYLIEKGFLNTDEEITPKVRWNKEAIYEVIE